MQLLGVAAKICSLSSVLNVGSNVVQGPKRSRTKDATFDNCKCHMHAASSHESEMIKACEAKQQEVKCKCKEQFDNAVHGT